jgi:hypothetical protein
MTLVSVAKDHHLHGRDIIRSLRSVSQGIVPLDEKRHRALMNPLLP